MSSRPITKQSVLDYVRSCGAPVRKSALAADFLVDKLGQQARLDVTLLKLERAGLLEIYDDTSAVCLVVGPTLARLAGCATETYVKAVAGVPA